MRNETWRKLESQFADFPVLSGEPAPEAEVDSASKEIGRKFPTDYREFLIRYGGAMVGPYPIFGVRSVEPMGNLWSVVEVNRRYRGDSWPGINGWVIFSRDHAGNPIGISDTQEVWVSDHGHVSRLAASFEEFLLNECLPNK
jgi:hypothetical protein